MDRIARRRCIRGFTVVEAMIVVAILGILAAIAMPSFASFIESQRAKNAASDLYIALTKARSEAIKQNRNVTLSPKGAWASGWQILDPTTNALIEDHEAVVGLTIIGPGNVIFQSSGRVSGGAAPQFLITGDYEGSTRSVIVDLSGRPLIKKGGV